MSLKSKIIFPILVGSLLGTALTAQVTRGHEVTLKNWQAPLYWQPSPAEAELRNPSPEAATPVGSLVFVAMSPCRVVDTRAASSFTSPFGTPTLTSGPPRTFALQSSTACSIPSYAQAYSLNLTVVPTGPLGYLTIWPTGIAQPTVVTLDDLPGQIVNNAAIVQAGTPNGSVSVVVSSSTELVIDINGYYAPATGITLAQGTAAAPSLSFSSDTGTGIFSSATGALNFTTGGTNQMTVDSAGIVLASGSASAPSLTFGDAGTGLFSSATQAVNITTGGSNRLTVRSDGDLDLAGSIRQGGTLFLHALGFFNTSVGLSAIPSSSTGGGNTACGFDVLHANTTGTNNTASGAFALAANTVGEANTASGSYALYGNTTGVANVASGSSALGANTTGTGNTASGSSALSTNTTGMNNTALGISAGGNITTTNNNVDIASPGVAGDDGVIRIGDSNSQSSFFAAGIRGVTTGSANAVAVMVDSNGQLGTVSSSRRFKEDIQDMSDASSGLLRLRPVTYRYQKPYADGSKPLDYGLIAEEVAEVYPDLVATGADGQTETVQYHKLVPMLLNELQKERRQRFQERQDQSQEIQTLRQQMSELRQALQSLMPSPVSK